MTGEGYAQAGAATFNTAVNWLLYGLEKKDIRETRAQEFAFAEQGQRLALQQQGFENQMAQRGAELQEAGFDFGKMKWGEEFGLTKKQALFNMKLAKSQEGRAAEAWGIEKKKSALTTIANSMNSVLGNDMAMKQRVATWMGANYGSR